MTVTDKTKTKPLYQKHFNSHFLQHLFMTVVAVLSAVLLAWNE